MSYNVLQGNFAHESSDGVKRDRSGELSYRECDSFAHQRARYRVEGLSCAKLLLAIAMVVCVGSHLAAQGLQIRHGSPVPVEVKTLYDAGLAYLEGKQLANGTWQSSSYGNGPGVDGLCCLAILSCGEDPNFGRYAETLRKGLRAIIRTQNDESGLLSQSRGTHGSMYHHGFGTLALAEAYGAVDDTMLWEGEGEGQRPLGEALEKAVRCIITSQDQNPYGGWRYTPDAKDADISVSGANIVALLAARNAGIEVPDENIEKAMKLLKDSTDKSGAVAYQVGSTGFAFGDSTARSSIACLSLAIAKQKDSEAFQNTLSHLTARIDRPAVGSWPHYTRYYQAQALFQGDFQAWQSWNEMNTEVLEESQSEDGSIGGSTYSTAMSLLSMALNYRFLPIYER